MMELNTIETIPGKALGCSDCKIIIDTMGITFLDKDKDGIVMMY